MNKRQIIKNIKRLYKNNELPKSLYIIIQDGYKKHRAKYRFNKHYKIMHIIIYNKRLTNRTQYYSQILRPKCVNGCKF